MSIVSIIGLVLGIAGAFKAVDGPSYNVTTLLQAALGMFIGCLGLMLAILVYLTIYAEELPKGEKMVLHSVYICSPFLIVRMVYAALGDYGSDPRFRLFDGNPTVYLCMGFLEEIILMIICLVVGFKCPPPGYYKNGQCSQPYFFLALWLITRSRKYTQLP